MSVKIVTWLHIQIRYICHIFYYTTFSLVKCLNPTDDSRAPKSWRTSQFKGLWFPPLPLVFTSEGLWSCPIRSFSFFCISNPENSLVNCFVFMSASFSFSVFSKNFKSLLTLPSFSLESSPFCFDNFKCFLWNPLCASHGGGERASLFLFLLFLSFWLSSNGF